MDDDATDVLVVGGGLAGLTAALFTARAGLSTRLVSAAEPILARNAHLENYPGFAAGVNARLLLDETREQARRAGADLVEGTVVDATPAGDGFAVTQADGDTMRAKRVVVASWSDVSYLDDLAVETVQRGSKRYVVVDEFGRTDADGVYAAGRVAGRHHQAVVAAGHGATVGLTVVEDSDVPFYHDWVAPAGYFTGRGREVPPGCEEIDEGERADRVAASSDRIREAFADRNPDPPTTHPSVAEDDDE